MTAVLSEQPIESALIGQIADGHARAQAFDQPHMFGTADRGYFRSQVLQEQTAAEAIAPVPPFTRTSSPLPIFAARMFASA